MFSQIIGQWSCQDLAFGILLNKLLYHDREFMDRPKQISENVLTHTENS